MSNNLDGPMSDAEVLALLDTSDPDKIVEIDVDRLVEWAKRNRTQFYQICVNMINGTI